jgi:hypothetical protein
MMERLRIRRLAASDLIRQVPLSVHGPAPARLISWVGPGPRVLVDDQVGRYTCWLVAATAVANFYAKKALWTDCVLGQLCLPKENCACTGSVPAGSPCDQTGELEDSLSVTGNLVPRSYPIPLTDAEIMTELGQDRVLGAKVRVPSSIPHIVLICAFADRGGVLGLWVKSPGRGTQSTYPSRSAFESRVAAWYLTKP